jgi:hypothetical protein
MREERIVWWLFVEGTHRGSDWMSKLVARGKSGLYGGCLLKGLTEVATGCRNLWPAFTPTVSAWNALLERPGPSGDHKL